MLRFEEPLLASMKVIAAKRELLANKNRPKNYLADEINTFSNEISDMRDMQKKLVDNYRIEIEELRRQRDAMLNQKPEINYLDLNRDFEDFNQGKFDLSYI